jgi:membrane protein
MTTSADADRERIARTLTFWLRPAFLLRVLGRFQRVAGFDRAIALASSALTGLIPLAILAGAVLPSGDGNDIASRLIVRYGLTGKGAEAVRDVLAPAGGESTSVTVVGVFLLLLAVLSFSRGMQRLFEQTWDLKPLSVRNTPNDLVWITGLVLFIGVSWAIHDLIGVGKVQVLANLVTIPVSAAFLVWSGRVLSGRRIPWRALIPFAIIGGALLALGLILAAIYLPHLFSVYASRYGVIGAVLAMISALFLLMVLIVSSTAVGREVSEELDRIRRGERPPDDEVRQQWDALIAEARSRWQIVRDRLGRIRGRRHR